MQRSNLSPFVAGCGLPLIGPELRKTFALDQNIKGANHPQQVYQFQDHPVLETILHFRIILGLEYARAESAPMERSPRASGKLVVVDEREIRIRG